MSTTAADAVDRALAAAGVADDVAFVDVPAVARVLGVSAWATYGAIKRGEIPSVRIGRRVLVGRGVLARLAEGGAEA